MGKITVSGAEPKRVSTASSATHNTLQRSTTLSRKYVRRPDIARPTAVKAARPAMNRKVAAGQPAMKAAAKTPAMAAKEAKDRAVKSALRSVATMENAENQAAAEVKPTKIKSKKKTRRLVLATLCSAATVGLLALFINANMPDISVKVAAIQTGIEASYPTYIPRGYSLSNVTSDKTGQIKMQFSADDENYFFLEESKSTWDSTALLNNYVKVNYTGEYATLREHGITIYIYNSEAVWVNGGVFYRISSQGTPLTKEQIRNLVVSL